MAIQIRHARLVCTYVVVTLLLTSLLIGKSQPTAILHHGSAADVQHAARFVLLNAVLAISAASLLFTSVGFSLAGLVLFGQRSKRDADGLHFSDSLPAEATLARQRREVAAHTLTAANWAVAICWLAFAWSLDSLRWALPPLPAWVTTCAAVLCAVNLATGAILAAKHSRWAPWLLPSHSPVPLNEPSRLVALLEQLRVRCFGRRPGLPRAQKSGGCARRVRRCSSWDGGAACSPQPIASPLQPSPQAASPCDVETGTPEPVPFGAAASQALTPQPFSGTARCIGAGFTARGGLVLCESSYHTPPRGIGRTYSEDEEVELSAGSVISIESTDSSDCGSDFMDVVQANILLHPDDTLEFLQKLSPERTPSAAAAPRQSLPELIARAVSGSKQQAQCSQQRSQQQQCEAGPPTPLQQQQSLLLPAAKAEQQASLLAAAPPASPLGALGFAERKRAMTRVSATVDELLGAIVGELV